jgi:two-component system, chemotaxis family, protein-glutamate methylesterase/glutaminase
MAAQVKQAHFPIVCLGSSAGGLTPCLRIIEKLPRDLGLAIVLVRHGRKQIYLPEIVRQHTEMPVLSIRQGLQVEPRYFYITPPNWYLMVSESRFQLNRQSKPHGWPDIITQFLESLAKSWPGPVVAVILSGLAADGVAALQAVKAAGGITIAQKVETAHYPDMPLNAIKSGCVDYVLPPGAIARALVKIARSSARARNQVEQANRHLGP